MPECTLENQTLSISKEPVFTATRMQVYLCKLSFTADEACFQQLSECISAERRQKLTSYAKAGDRFRSLFAELLLRFALSELDQYHYLNRSKCNSNALSGAVRNVSEETLIASALSSLLPPLHFLLGEHGKPLPIGEIHFNLSHSGAYVACVLSTNECGIDIQEQRPIRENLLRRNLTKEEQTTLFTYEGAERDKHFFEYWVLKEAFIKAIGAGLSFPLNHVSFEVSKNNTVKTISEPTFLVRLFEIEEGYKLAAGFLENKC